MASHLAGSVLLLLLGIGAAPAAAQMPGSMPMCPSAGTGFALRCLCWGAQASVGHVWGSGPYANESAICAAARHAGVIGEDGGAVRVVPMPGQASYRGSHRNGITSADRGASSRSFRLERATAAWGATPRAP